MQVVERIVFLLVAEVVVAADFAVFFVLRLPVRGGGGVFHRVSGQN